MAVMAVITRGLGEEPRPVSPDRDPHGRSSLKPSVFVTTGAVDADPDALTIFANGDASPL